MKKICSTKTVLTIIFVLFLPLLNPFSRGILNPTIRGYVKQPCPSPSTGLQDVYIKGDDGYETCSLNAGLFSFDPSATGGNKIVTFRMKGYQINPLTVNNLVNYQTTDIGVVCLEQSTPNYEISGTFIGDVKKGVTVKLYQLTCGGSYSEIASTKTCSDGTYSFSGQRMPDGTVSDLSAGTYKVMPVCSVCTFSDGGNPPKNYIENIPIPNTQQYNFYASCSPGGC